MATEAKKLMQLRSISDLQEAHEFVFNQQRDGKIDGKTADGLNTTLKGAVYLNAKRRMDALKLYILAAKAKIQVPPIMLPEGMRPTV